MFYEMDRWFLWLTLFLARNLTLRPGAAGLMLLLYQLALASLALAAV